MVKKQTVWLLTMLSLMIVLSVYYMTAPEGDEMAFINDEELKQNDEGEEMAADVTEEGTSISQMSTEELFAAIRMEKQDARDKHHEQLSDIVASSDYSTEEKNDALQEMQQLQELQTKESILETTIQANAQYDDVLVRVEDDVINVTVKANELSKKETNNIIKMAVDEFGEKPVRVQFQPSK
ncbi:SpoIIIAH-like family protein [Thalassobacillus devorans]|uniref:SpoIIIAH-like family protein n=1 Tax=Thalassobacillus devorans TaxID=279813 RepID=UPI00048CB8E8|nr:SpoIIIAH-like family protein [Thalassobacillus devorans]